MTNKLKKTLKTRAIAKSGNRHSLGCNDSENVAHALDLVLKDSDSQTNPIEEQLRQCPEAFKAGEMLERALNSLKYGHDEVSEAERWLPPAGAVMPPIV